MQEVLNVPSFQPCHFIIRLSLICNSDVCNLGIADKPFCFGLTTLILTYMGAVTPLEARSAQYYMLKAFHSRPGFTGTSVATHPRLRLELWNEANLKSRRVRYVHVSAFVRFGKSVTEFSGMNLLLYQVFLDSPSFGKKRRVPGRRRLYTQMWTRKWRDSYTCSIRLACLGQHLDRPRGGLRCASGGYNAYSVW